MFAKLAEGGVWMIPIGIVSVVSLALIIERVVVLFFKFRLDAQALTSRVMRSLEDRDLNRAIEVCNVEGQHPLPIVLKAGLVKGDLADKDIQRAMESATLSVLPMVTNRISYLSMLANVATLLGLLGTIMGLIDCFEAVSTADAAKKQVALSEGISVAMLTTAGGLIAAIPSIVAHAFLSARQNAILSSLEASATELFSYLSLRNRRLRQSK
jgi:biopolymer transport protein ExbB